MSKATTTNAKNTDSGKGIRNFKHSSDVENFYRFVYESNFRREASIMLNSVLKVIAPSKKRSRKKQLQ